MPFMCRMPPPFDAISASGLKSAFDHFPAVGGKDPGALAFRAVAAFAVEAQFFPVVNHHGEDQDVGVALAVDEALVRDRQFGGVERLIRFQLLLCRG